MNGRDGEPDVTLCPTSFPGASGPVPTPIGKNFSQGATRTSGRTEGHWNCWTRNIDATRESGCGVREQRVGGCSWATDQCSRKKAVNRHDNSELCGQRGKKGEIGDMRTLPIRGTFGGIIFVKLQELRGKREVVWGKNQKRMSGDS